MIIEEMMRTEIKTLSPLHTIKDALNLFHESKIRHAIITEDDKLVGIVSNRDIQRAYTTLASDERIIDVHLSRVMTKNPIVGHPLDFVEEVAMIFYDQQISCLPIVNGGELVGIVTETDVLYKYIELTGANQPGSHIEVRVPDKPGVLFEVSKVFHDHQTNVWSVLVHPDAKDSHMKILEFRVKTMNPLSIIEDLRKEGFDVLWPNLPGMTN